MTRGRPERLVDYCRDRAGRSLRSVILYDDDRHRSLYVRDDLADEFDDAALATFIDHLRDIHDLSAPADGHDLSAPADGRSPHGRMRTGVYVYDEAMVMHHLLGPERAVVVLFDLDAGRNLTSFIGGCLDIVYEDSPLERE